MFDPTLWYQVLKGEGSGFGSRTWARGCGENSAVSSSCTQTEGGSFKTWAPYNAIDAIMGKIDLAGRSLNAFTLHQYLGGFVAKVTCTRR